MQFERLNEDRLAAYERCFFKDVCRIPTGTRKTFSTPLPEINGLHFACVQDTVERLTEMEYGRLSAFQWRNFIFAPVNKDANVKNLYGQVFEELRNRVPSIFIRSYVYLVFVKVYGSGSLPFSEKELVPNPRDFSTYYWNTNYEIISIGPSRLAQIGNPIGAGGKGEAGNNRRQPQKVFIVSDPKAELQRIQDSNSDVIDAVKAFTGSLDLYKETLKTLDKIETALTKPGAKVLLEGPARSGKTVIAMSLLGSNPNAKMLLMNWYFYSALKDAFKIWAKLDEKAIAKLFETSREVELEIERNDSELAVLRGCEYNPHFITQLIKMWRGTRPKETSGWFKSKSGAQEGEWLITNCKNKKAGDIVCVKQAKNNMLQLHVIQDVLENGLARPVQIFSKDDIYNNRPLDNTPNTKADDANAPEKIIQRLEQLNKLIEAKGIEAAIVSKIKAAAEAIDSSDQRFFHHDRSKEDGLWILKDEILISDNVTFICDEAQRLGDYYDLDEAEWVHNRRGRTFLCGDNNQMLNSRGDTGLEPIVKDMPFEVYPLTTAVGIPAEIELLVKSMLDKSTAPVAPKSFSIKLLFKDDLGLVDEFHRDPHGKKHFAMPLSTGFYKRGYMPCIKRLNERTDRCTEECDSNPYGICEHRYILPLSPLSDRDWLPHRKDLSKSYKFFCAEEIMPNYALSAYELISREVESIYLKIPWQINSETLQAPIDGKTTNSWIKRHLYVLMTRATARLVINIEDKRLYESFKQTCSDAGVEC